MTLTTDAFYLNYCGGANGSSGYGPDVYIASGANVSIDSFTLSYAIGGIYGSYTVLP